jgi:two-component system sensor histidine kinase SenX3
MTTALLLVVVGAVCFVVGWVTSGRRSAGGAGSPEADADPRPSLDDVIGQHPIGVVVGDRLGRVEYRNAAARRLSGTHHGVLIDEAIEHHLELARARRVPDRTLEFHGPPRMVYVISARQLPDGRSVAFIEDISERTRIEQSRTDFVANISHELKTPVGAISVLAETLAGERDPDTVARLVARVLAESDRASHTIDDLMELSRIEIGEDRSFERVAVDDVIAGAVDRASELADRHGITISSPATEAADDTTGGTAPGTLAVVGDRRQLVSAVGNLVENAVKYSDPGSSVQVAARRVGDRVEISVRDQGIGIPQRDLDRIFERFYRVDRARSRSTGGTGLGLSIVRHVAGNHDGDVSVTSVEGEGSTFVLRLPIAVAGERQQANDHAEGVA